MRNRMRTVMTPLPQMNAMAIFWDDLADILGAFPSSSHNNHCEAVENQDQEKEHNPDSEQSVLVQPTGVRYLDCYAAGEAAGWVKWRGGNLYCIAHDHNHSHCLSDGSANAQDTPTYDARTSRGDKH